MAVTWDEKTDYKKLMDEAVAAGDYTAAAKYEQQRNAKINALNEAGTNKWNATTSTDYAQYLGSPAGTNDSKVMTADDLALLNTYKQQYNIASSLGDQSTADAMHLAAEALRGSYNYSGGADGTEYIPIHPEATNPTVTADVPSPTFNYEKYLEDNAKPEYEASYSAMIDAALEKILNREAFSYDAESDPIFQQVLSTYNREGKRAMNDTLASAAAGAGGMNSYAITAAQQANNYYASQAADKIPELYQLAYQMYLDDIDLQVQDLGLLEGADQKQYDRYRDTMSDWRDDLDFAYGKYLDDRDEYHWDKNFDYGAYWDDKNFNYNTEQEASNEAYDRAMKLLGYGAMPDDEMLKKAGLSTEQAHAILKANGFPVPSSGGTSSGGVSSGGYTANYNNAGLDPSVIKAIQDKYGAGADGLWGAETTAKVGMTAAEWLAKYGNTANTGGGTPTYTTSGNDGSPAHTTVPYIPNYYEKVVYDLDDLISGNPQKGEVASYINGAVSDGLITKEQGEKLKDKYAPRGLLY